MSNVQYVLEDPEKRRAAGLPPQTAASKKLINPFFDATELERQGDRKGAERIYLELLNTDFDNPVLMAALGMNYAAADKSGLANLLLQTALRNFDDIIPGFKRLGITPKSDDPKGVDQFAKIKRSEILNAIGTCFKHENRTAEARKYFEHAQEGLPINADIQNNLGTLHINEGHPAGALAHLDAAIAADPNHAQAHWNRSLAYLELGDYERGWPEYHYGIAAKVRMDRNYTKGELPFWDGTPGKRLVVYGEQGIGDEILFASCLPDLLRDCPNTVFECHKKLHKLFANSFPNIDIFPTREDEVLTWPLKQDGTPRYTFDAKLALGDLPRFYRNSLGQFPGVPYIKPIPATELAWNEKLAGLGRKPKIGISWAGGHKRTRVEVRSLALEQLLPILQQDADFISLQYTPCEHELAEFTDKHGITIHHWPEAVYSPSYDDTAGLVANLDLVITVCTSVVHLAGSMGVPTWVLTPSRPAWRYRLDLDSMPWYSSVTLFRQAEGSAEWIPVVNEVAENLSQLLGAANGH